MPVHICPRCHRSFDRKSNYEQHLRRKVPCPLVEKQSHPLITDSKCDNLQDSQKISVKLSLKNQQKFYCEYCGQGFTRFSNMKRHQESRCSTNFKKINNSGDSQDRIPLRSSEEGSISKQDFISLCNEVEKLKNAPPIQVNNQNILQ